MLLSDSKVVRLRTTPNFLTEIITEYGDVDMNEEEIRRVENRIDLLFEEHYGYDRQYSIDRYVKAVFLGKEAYPSQWTLRKISSSRIYK